MPAFDANQAEPAEDPVEGHAEHADRPPLTSVSPGSLIDTLQFSDQRQFKRYCSEHEETMKQRWLTGQQLDMLCSGTGQLPGWCPVCRTPAQFRYQVLADDSINLREDLACDRCQLSARVRCAMALLDAVLGAGSEPDIYITEQTSRVYRCLKRRFTNVIGSEYFEEHQREALEDYLHGLGPVGDALRFEDVTSLSLDPESVDAVLSFEVLEHVPDYISALREFFRVLRPGGVFIATIPFMQFEQDTVKRAEIDENGAILHLLEPEYHGDPVSPDGVLVYQDFGWDILEALKAAGFTEACWNLSWGIAAGIPEHMWTLSARR